MLDRVTPFTSSFAKNNPDLCSFGGPGAVMGLGLRET